ncbi:hypothetical protein T265_04244 [Opisthorchis viverrini]|uniref:Uncharacterized protein n=1 Tax=Opisthorchis viverrini TaxID=6198 RepID=A0A074ZNT8_OPIVI|nr:hypothetical protein T265_04244 [Opisthorchis viverrini]KER29058.1 hypothetical protein T265_04244 [Opisthorchis viverrini]
MKISDNLLRENFVRRCESLSVRGNFMSSIFSLKVMVGKDGEGLAYFIEAESPRKRAEETAALEQQPPDDAKH